MSKTTAVAAVADLMDGDDKIVRGAILEDRMLVAVSCEIVAATLRAENVERDDRCSFLRRKHTNSVVPLEKALPLPPLLLFVSIR